MSNELLEKIESQINRELLVCETKGIHNFRITENIRFHDEIWDFNEFNVSKRERYQYRFNFDKIQSMFVDGVKLVILKKLFRKDSEFSSVQQKFNYMTTIGNFLKEEDIDDIRLVDVSILKKFFEQKTINVSNATRNRRARMLIDVLEEYHKHDGLDEIFLIKYLNNFIGKHKEEKSITSKNEYIPDSILNQVVSFAVKDLNNDKVPIRDRITAGMIIMLAEIGMRIEEASLLEKNRLSEMGDGENKIYYLKFYTFKSTPNGEEKVLTESFLNDLSLHAYIKLCDLRDQIVNNLNEITRLNSMIRIKEDMLNTYSRKITELRAKVSSYSEEEILEIEKEMDKYIFLDYQSGLLKRGGVVLRNNIQEFYVRHDKDFDLTHITNSQIKSIKTFKIASENIYNKFFLKNMRCEYPFDKIKKKTYVRINPHAFRITVCTKLFLNGVHLDYIVKHLNHLTEDVTMYYNKSVEFEKKLEDTIDIFSQNANVEGVIEINPDKAKDGILKEELRSDEFRSNINNINKFLQRNKFNINCDTKKIMKILKKTNSPLIENSLGICIVSVVQKLCEKRKYFSTMDDNYYIGIQLKTYKNINNSYKRFKQKMDVINHNKQISLENPVYKNEFEREVKALKYYINKALKTELDLLDADIIKRGENDIIEEYPYLKDIITNLEKIRKEVMQWVA